MPAFAITILVLYMALFITLLIRNEMVFRYKERLINAIAAANQTDIANGKYDCIKWRWDKLHEVSYDKMMYQF